MEDGGANENTDDPTTRDVEDEDEKRRRMMSAALRQSKFMKKLHRFYNWLSYSNIKSFARWALESATCTISFTVSGWFCRRWFWWVNLTICRL
jgi:hypothetical protein